MSTTLTSTITQIDISRLKRDLEAIGDIRVVSITPPNGAIPTTVILTKSDRVSNLSPSQQTQAQTILDSHVDLIDSSAQEVAQTRSVIGTIGSGSIEFINDGLAWKIGPDKNLVPVGIGRQLGSAENPVDVIYANSIVGASVGGGGGGGTPAIYNEVPVGLIDGSNQVFTTVSHFVIGTTRVFYNGLRITLGAGNDYQETASNQITLNFVPESGDEIIVDYDLA